MRWFLILFVGVGLLGLLVALFQDEPAERVPSPRTPPSLEVADQSTSARTAARTSARNREPAPPRPSRDRYESIQRDLRPSEPSTIAQLARATTLHDALYRLDGLPKDVAPTRQLDRFGEALERAREPLARQYMIFLAALTVPYDLVEPWLRDVWADGEPGDREDALCALAFSGEPDALNAFRALGVEKGILKAAWPLVKVNERRFLRSYRCIEVLDRRPYYKGHYVNVRVPFLAHPQPNEGMDRTLREAWLTRYAGHPGSDDAALRIALSYQKADNQFDAARWFSRAATLPDRDKLGRAARLLVSTSEIALTPEQLDILAHDKGLDSPNRTLLQYVRLRRVAAGRGCERALAMAAGVAMAEPDSLIGYAWHNRWAVPVTRGVNSGLQPLQPGDPLLRIAPRSAPPKAKASIRSRSGLEYRWEGTEKERRNPWPEALVIRPDLLARQFRAWETLAELDRRRGGDMLYKRAAVLYHNRNAFFPVYGQHTEGFATVIQEIMRATGRKDQHLRFEAESFAWLRALDAFRRIERDAPGYPAMDRVLFSRGIALKRLLDYRPYQPWYWRRERLKPMVLELIAVFERCADSFPDSPLAPDARRAARYWRSNVPN